MPNQTKRNPLAGRAIQLYMRSNRQSAATCALIDSTCPGLGLRPCFARLCHTVPTGSIRSRLADSLLPSRLWKAGSWFRLRYGRLGRSAKLLSLLAAAYLVLLGVL
jgi:hypothetical protein